MTTPYEPDLREEVERLRAEVAAKDAEIRRLEARALGESHAMIAVNGEMERLREEVDAHENWRCTGPDAPESECIHLAAVDEMCAGCAARHVESALSAAKQRNEQLEGALRNLRARCEPWDREETRGGDQRRWNQLLRDADAALTSPSEPPSDEAKRFAIRQAAREYLRSEEASEPPTTPAPDLHHIVREAAMGRGSDKWLISYLRELGELEYLRALAKAAKKADAEAKRRAKGCGNSPDNPGDERELRNEGGMSSAISIRDAIRSLKSSAPPEPQSGEQSDYGQVAQSGTSMNSGSGPGPSAEHRERRADNPEDAGVTTGPALHFVAPPEPRKEEQPFRLNPPPRKKCGHLGRATHCDECARAAPPEPKGPPKIEVLEQTPQFTVARFNTGLRKWPTPERTLRDVVHHVLATQPGGRQAGSPNAEAHERYLSELATVAHAVDEAVREREFGAAPAAPASLPKGDAK